MPTLKIFLASRFSLLASRFSLLASRFSLVNTLKKVFAWREIAGDINELTFTVEVND